MIHRLVLHALQLVLVAAAAGALLVALFGIVPPPTTSFILQSRLGEALRGTAAPIEYQWMPRDRISPDLLLAVIAAEDQLFSQHRGFDIQAIEKAVDNNRRGKTIRGASTITQQVAKNLFLWPGRSYVRKAIEAYFTVVIEMFWSKERILECYVNIVQFGEFTYGAEAAARRFFGVAASELSREQAALLASVLPSPAVLRADAPSAYVRRRQRWILSQMTALGGRAHLRKLAGSEG
ncbi:MAG TPA: monofunctional biosynthetic peptidoglycan transglycosylase [Candidatus Limnocylindrales bacterium]|nr:monofunctional biosynthetic peptidoglycan transglycosylase [Candidatus Limnocylindrales bacterium]